MIQIEREKLEKVLEALEVEYRMYEATDPETGAPYNMIEAINAIKEALAQSEQEPVAQPRGLIDIGRIFTPEKAEEPKPVAWKKKGAFNFCNQPPVDVEKWIPLYTTPQQRTWVGLTDEERKNIMVECESTGDWAWELKAAQAIEAKLKEKNT